MNLSSRRLKWAIALVAILTLALSLRHLRDRHRQASDELAQLARNAAEIKSALLLIAEGDKQSGNRAAPAIDGAMDRSPLTPLERRQRDLLAWLDQGPPRTKSEPRPPTPSGPHGNVYFSELLESPGYNEKLKDIFRASVESRYGPWLRTLASADIRAEAEKLLLKERFLELEAEEAVARSGLDLDKNRNQVTRLQNQLRASLNAERRELLGAAEDARFVAYTATILARESIAPLVKRLSYSAEPITPAQIDRIVAVMPERNFGPRAGPNQPTVEEVLTPAKNLFSPGQWEDVQGFAREGGTLGR
ncbi:MAG: hypothetical protein ABIO94_08165 [Opitutaceae bacterium]